MSLTSWDIERLRESIADAEAAGRAGAWPFAAQITRGGVVLSRTDNQVAKLQDPTAHAEIAAIREATQKAGRADAVCGATIYVNAEPCAMCAAAIHWAGIKRLVFGVGEPVLRQLYGKQPPFSPLVMSCLEVLSAEGATVEVVGPVLEDEAAEIHREFWLGLAATRVSADIVP